MSARRHVSPIRGYAHQSALRATRGQGVAMDPSILVPLTVVFLQASCSRRCHQRADLEPSGAVTQIMIGPLPGDDVSSALFGACTPHCDASLHGRPEVLYLVREVSPASSNGRTEVFGTSYRGSNPCAGTEISLFLAGLLRGRSPSPRCLQKFRPEPLAPRFRRAAGWRSPGHSG